MRVRSQKGGAVAALALPLLVVIACAEGSSDDPSASFPGDLSDGGKEGAALPPTGDGETPAPPVDDGGKDSGKDSGSTVNAACAAALATATFTFDSGPEAWTTATSDGASSPPAWPYNPWAHGTAANGTPCSSGKCFGTELTQNYAQCQRGHLVSPTIDLADCKGEDVALIFRHAFAFWSQGTDALDGGIVEISGDNGATWEIPSASYPGTIKIRDTYPSLGAPHCVPTTFRVNDKQGFVKTQRTTSDFEISLPADLVTSTVRVRFSFASGVNYDGTSAADSRANTDFGWRIDDVHFVLK